MLRGSQKQMIVVRTRDSRMFEEAYFVMRRGAGRSEADELDMLWEANRIIENSLPREGHRPSVPSRAGQEPCSLTASTETAHVRHFDLAAGLVWFIVGFVSGGGLIGLLWLLL